MFTRQTHAPSVGLGLWCCLAALVGVAGCGKEKSNLLPVEGTVMLGDQVLATDAKTKGMVVLFPDKNKGNESLEIPRGSIDGEGKYKILTGLKPGVTPGWYKVTVDAAKVIDPKNPYHSVSGFLMPERYIDKEQSDLAFEVVENPPPGAYNLKLGTK